MYFILYVGVILQFILCIIFFNILYIYYLYVLYSLV